jgi:hypothetical protein
MELDQVGRALLFIGGGILLLGAVLLLISRVPGLNRLGKLPGDIRIEGENFTCFAPIVSMLLLSILLSLALNLIARLLNR